MPFYQYHPHEDLKDQLDEEYTDLNKNKKWDEGESFIDENQNGLFDENEQYIDEKEHLIWKELYNSTYLLAYDNSIKMYKIGISNFCNLVSDFPAKMPNLNNISSIINNETGWKIKVVAGFVDEIIFFRLLRDKFFPSSDIIRQSKRFYKKLRYSFCFCALNMSHLYIFFYSVIKMNCYNPI